MRLLVVSGSPPDELASRARPSESAPPSRPGPGLPRHAPSVKISTSGSRPCGSGDQLARQLEDHALGRVVGISSVTSKRSRSASTTSRTSTSGADAPAVMPSVCGCAEPVPVDVGGALDQPGRNAHPLGDLGQAQRIAAVGRADHQHPVAFAAAIALTAAWRFEVA